MTVAHEHLERATKLIAGTYEGPHCIEAAALMLEVGDQLGYRLEARPVSLFAHNYTSTGNVATGTFGRAFGESFLARRGDVALGGEFEGGTPFQRHAGHMIVVSEEHSLLLDPTFAQFEQLGEQAVALFASNVRFRGGRFWQVGTDEFFARYFAADDFMELDFEKVRAAVIPRANEIVTFLKK